MSFQVPAKVGQLVAMAHGGGVETSLGALSDALELSGSDILTVAEEVENFVAAFSLELVPACDQGSYSSGRVLRSVVLGPDIIARIDRIREEGENQSAEFKSSLFCSMRDWTTKGTLVDFPSLPGEVLKTICAFLNGDGGQLLIGIDDGGDVCEGISLDLKLKNWSLDKWQLHLLSLIRGRFFDGDSVVSYVQIASANLEPGPVVLVSVVARDARSFVKRENGAPFEFFIRKGPRTESLDLPSFNAHLASISHL